MCGIRVCNRASAVQAVDNRFTLAMQILTGVVCCLGVVSWAGRLSLSRAMCGGGDGGGEGGEGGGREMRLSCCGYPGFLRGAMVCIDLEVQSMSMFSISMSPRNGPEIEMLGREDTVWRFEARPRRSNYCPSPHRR